MGRFDVAQICLSGHIINTYARSESFNNNNFCITCGEKTITKCLTCEHEIRGEYSVTDWTEYGSHLEGQYEVPSYCSECGQAFPWTLTRIESAQELACELEGLTEDERELLANSIPDLIKDSPRTPLAVTRFKKLTSKLGAPTLFLFKDILFDVVKEGVKKAIFE